MRVAASAVLVAAAYYVGANIGLILRFPPTTPSVLWPPNSILTATLLLSPTRRWWFLLLAALPAHLAAELPTGWPLSLVMALFVTNCMEAVTAAALMRRFSDDATRFDTLKRAGVFIVAAGLVAPLLSTFADATAVWAALPESYWHVWMIRLSSNVVTALTVVPAIVTVVTVGPLWLQRASRWRHLEAALLAVGLFDITFLLFSSRQIEAGPIPGAPVTPMIFLLPFVLWAAVRFGPGGTSLALLAIAIVASWAATYGGGAPTGVRAESVLALQVSLAVVAIPMMCLTALIEERRRAERALGERLRFEELLSRLSGEFVHLASHEMAEAFDRWFAQLGEFIGLERITLARRSGDGQTSAVVHSWTAADVEDAQTESNVMFPLVAGERVLGSIRFTPSALAEPRSDELMQRLHVVAEVFGSALARKDAEDALRAGEAMKSAILASLISSVAVLDRDGWIIAVNDSWTHVAGELGMSTLGVGVNYLDACREVARMNVPVAAELLDGVRAVLDHTRPAFTVEYAHPNDRERWFAASVVPLNRAEGGAVMSHTEITERKQAEHDAQQSRQELAHFTRVSTIGELAASLAHELNQPLAGILLNAQTARHFLDATPPALDDVRDIIADIIADDARAAEVIRRLRDLLRKSDAQRVRLDLNSLVRDVTRLVSSDAIIRSVTVKVDCCDQPVWVNGDRIQLQQVVLNLLMNAMEAVADSAVENRTVTVRTDKTGETVCVSVQDTGPGLRAGTDELVFEPFYTTKPTGMGMGLSIVRSILRAHDGMIAVANNPSGGSTFQFELPLAVEEAR